MQEPGRESQQDCDWGKKDQLAKSRGQIPPSRPKVKSDPAERPNNQISVQTRVDEDQLREPAETRNCERRVEVPQIDCQRKDDEHKGIVPGRLVKRSVAQQRSDREENRCESCAVDELKVTARQRKDQVRRDQEQDAECTGERTPNPVTNPVSEAESECPVGAQQEREA